MKTLTIRLPQAYHFAIRQAVATFNFRSNGEVVRIAILDTLARKHKVGLKHHVTFDTPCNMVVSCKLPDEIHDKLANSYCIPRALTMSELSAFVVIEWLKTLYKEDKRQQKGPYYVQWRQGVGPSLRAVYNF